MGAERAVHGNRRFHPGLPLHILGHAGKSRGRATIVGLFVHPWRYLLGEILSRGTVGIGPNQEERAF